MTLTANTKFETMAGDAPLTTVDGFLNRRVILEQPSKGYRIAIDTVLLAAAVPALIGDNILDMGCGVGGGMICVSCRVPQITGIGLESHQELITLCAQNISRNVFASKLKVEQGDATHLPDQWESIFDHVLMNPPYHEADQYSFSKDPMKQAANSEKTGDLALWIASAAKALKPSAVLTLIHRADRFKEIVACLEKAFGDIEVLPLLPHKNQKPKRVIIRARKDGAWPTKYCDPLILHQESGAYTEEAEAILRHAQRLLFQSP